MKKLLLSVLTIASIYSANSQVIFSEDFDGIGGSTAGGAGTYSFPSGWTLANVDNVAPNTSVAYMTNAWIRREDFAFNVADSAAFSSSWINPAGQVDDWMWTPLMGPLPANCQLTWNAVAYDASFPDGYEVRVMTAPQGPPNGSAGVLGNQVTNSTVIFSTAAEASAWTAHAVNLGSYAGQSIYIGFRNHSTDQFVLAIDDIKVEVNVNYDAKLVSTVGVSEYTAIPLQQASALNFSGNILNNGALGLTNVALNVNVRNSSNAVVYNASSAATALAAGANATYTVAPYTPTTADAYSIEYYVSATEADQETSNDTLYQDLIITDTVYARDNADITGALGIGAGNGGYLGQEFIVNTADDLTSVSIFYTRGYIGKKYAAVVWNMAAGTPSTIIAATDTLLYPSDTSLFATLPLHGGPLNLAPGSYVVTAVEFDSTLQVAQTSGLFTAGRTWVNWPTTPLGGWGNNEAFGSGFAKSYVIRANFGDACAGVIDVTTNLVGSTVSANATSATYQWLDCNAGNAPIAGETNQSYTPATTGNYAVVVSNGACSDTSACVAVTVVGLQTVSAATGAISIYPNPNNGSFTIKSRTSGVYTITNELGQVVKTIELNTKNGLSIAVNDLSTGVYLISGVADNKSVKEKIVVTK